MLRIDRLVTLQGVTCNGYFVRNARNKVLAIGAYGVNPFVMPSRKRYARDVELCKAIARLTKHPIKWNLTIHGKDVHS